MLVVNELFAELEHLLDEFLGCPKAIDLFLDLSCPRSLDLAHGVIGICTFVVVIFSSLQADLVLSLEGFNVLEESCSCLDKLVQAFLVAVPVRIVCQLEEHVEDSSFDLLAISVRVQSVPQLHQELFLT